MLLTLSVENTCLIMGIFDHETLLFTSRMAADRNKTSDEYAISFRSILELHHITISDIQGSIICSVVPALVNELKVALTLLLGQDAILVGPGIKTGLNILMDNPASLGSDLVVNAVAALAEYQTPLIVIDLDTATTLSAINSKKNYIGTIIAPGAALSAVALSNACDQLPRVSLDAPKDIIGKNTIDSIRSGVVYGTAAMLDGLIERIEHQLGPTCTVIATGSLAGVIAPHCRRDIIVDERLLHKGLRRIYEKNTQNSNSLIPRKQTRPSV